MRRETVSAELPITFKFDVYMLKPSCSKLSTSVHLFDEFVHDDVNSLSQKAAAGNITNECGANFNEAMGFFSFKLNRIKSQLFCNSSVVG